MILDRFKLTDKVAIVTGANSGVGVGKDFILMIQNSSKKNLWIPHHLSDGDIQRKDIGRQNGGPAFVSQAESQINGALIMAIAYSLFEQRIVDATTGDVLNAGINEPRISQLGRH